MPGLAAAVRPDRQWMTHRGEPDWAGVGDNDGTTHLGLPADDQWSVDELLERLDARS
jgi:hypothetical protein